jgi:hypothetical protein
MDMIFEGNCLANPMVATVMLWRKFVSSVTVSSVTVADYQESRTSPGPDPQ